MAHFSEALRRLYHDLVVRRSRVQVVPSRPVELKSCPIFVVGLYRSGTTLLRYILDSHSRICCPPESNFMIHLKPLIVEEFCRTGFEPMGFDTDHVLRRIREFSAYFFENYAGSKGKVRWADKTPSYVDHADFLMQVFPEAQFVTLHRHGFDQADSFALSARRKGGPAMREALRPYVQSNEDPRKSALRCWCDKTQNILRFEARHPTQCIRLRYEDVCERPEVEIRRLFEFLEEPWEPAVLRFYEFSHDIGNEDGRVMATRGFSPSTMRYTAWPKSLLTEAEAMAGATLRELGYDHPAPESDTE